MNVTHILLSLISGGVGGNIAGALLKKYSLRADWQHNPRTPWRGCGLENTQPHRWWRRSRDRGETFLGLWLAAAS